MIPHFSRPHTRERTIAVVCRGMSVIQMQRMGWPGRELTGSVGFGRLPCLPPALEIVRLSDAPRRACLGGGRDFALLQLTRFAPPAGLAPVEAVIGRSPAT